MQTKEEVERVVREYGDAVINDSKVELKDDVSCFGILLLIENLKLTLS